MGSSMYLSKALAIAICIFIAAPLVIVIPMSFSSSISLEFPPPGYSLKYYYSYFTDMTWLRPTMNSVIIALLTSIGTMLLITPAAFAMTRGNFRGKSAVTLLIMLPMAAPSIVLALAYFYFFGTLRISQTHLGVVLAHICVGIPMSFLVLCASLKGFDRNIERAAFNLGATPLKAFWYVIFPVLRPAFLVSAFFSFIHSFDETVISVFISGRDAETLPRKMFDSVRMDADPVIAVVSTLLFTLVLAGTLTVTLRRRQARKIGK